MGRQVMLVGFHSQLAADASNAVAFPTGLLDSSDKVLKVKSVEWQFSPNTVMTWAKAVDNAAVFVVGNKDKGLTIGLQHRSVVKSFALSVSGVAAATTDLVIPVDFTWTPNYDTYLYNETFYAIIGSFGTGVVNSGTFRIACEEVTVSLIDKAQMRALI